MSSEFFKNNPKIIKSWCLYDWANSVYSLTITAAIFPVYFQHVALNETGGDVVNFLGFQVVNSVLYSYALSFSFLLVACMLPLLSGIADYTGKKKTFLRMFMIIGAISCSGMYFFTSSSLEWGIFCSIFASVGYSASLVFYDAYLPEIVTRDQTDKVSARGYSMGYIGGVILLIFNLITIQFYDFFGFANEANATRFSFLTVGIWWLVFGTIALNGLPGNIFQKSPTGNVFNKGYQELSHVWNKLKSLRNMRKFLISFFCYNTGVQTVMYLAATFGAKELKLDASKLIMTVLLIQFLGIAGAYLFAWVSSKKGNILSLIAMIMIWIGVCIGAFFTYQVHQFYLLASVAGLVMGGIQALSRATFSKLIPDDQDDHTSFFSFYDVTFNISIVVGTFAYGLVEQLTGSMRNSTIALGIFFVFGLIGLLSIKDKKLLQPA